MLVFRYVTQFFVLIYPKKLYYTETLRLNNCTFSMAKISSIMLTTGEQDFFTGTEKPYGKPLKSANMRLCMSSHNSWYISLIHVPKSKNVLGNVVRFLRLSNIILKSSDVTIGNVLFSRSSTYFHWYTFSGRFLYSAVLLLGIPLRRRFSNSSIIVLFITKLTSFSNKACEHS